MTATPPNCPAITARRAWIAASQFFCVCLVVITAFACSQKTLPAYGQVILLLSTDMQIPDSFDTLILAVDNQGTVTYRAYAAPGVAPSNAAVFPCDVPNVASKLLDFPTTIALTSGRDVAVNVTLELTACKDGKVVFTRKGIDVDVPEPGQLRILREPIQWLCADRSQACFTCAGKNCYHQSISAALDETNAAMCTAPACDDRSSDWFKPAPYDANQVFRHGGAATPKPDCFDPWTCFDLDQESDFAPHAWFPIAAGWSSEIMGDSGADSCVATPDESVKDSSMLNVALVLPPGRQGFCDQYRCVVPLDTRSAVGWSWDSSNAGRIVLPAAVCHMLDSGQILYVMGSTQCPRKGAEYPFCGAPRPTLPIPSGAANTNATLEEGTWTHLPLDEQADANVYLSDTHNQNPLVRVGAASSDISTPIAVKGRAGVFNSLAFAKNRFPQEALSSYTLSAWVSPTELTEAVRDEPGVVVLPILSNLSKDCSTGSRLELRTCNDRSTIVLAFGVPKGLGSESSCKMQYTFATLGEKSFAGGFSTPWQSGNFYHVVGTFAASSAAATLYVDGVPTFSPAVGCADAQDIEAPSDNSDFYLGTSTEALNQAPGVSPDLIIDEVMLFDLPLSPIDVKWLFLETSTVSGPSGLRWGTWANQGSVASVEEDTLPLAFRIEDKKYSSGGGYALLGEPENLRDLSTEGSNLPQLLDYDEAVLVATVPTDVPFQFSFVGSHGERQCTWQLRGKSKEADSDTYVINLRKPSWCIAPKCTLEGKRFEKVSFGTDWATSAEKPLAFQISALAFRNRPSDTTTAQVASGSSLGGIVDLNGWCWKSVTYDSAWEMEPARADRSSASVIVDKPKDYATPQWPPPELAADLPDFDGRDLSVCATIDLYLELRDHVSDLVDKAELAIQNDFGQTWTWPILDPTASPARVEVSSPGSGGWPPNENLPRDQYVVLAAATRLSVRYAGRIEVRGLKCCTTANGPCTDIGPSP